MSMQDHESIQDFSIFGGHLIGATPIDEAVAAALRAHAIEDSEQLLAIAAIPEARGYLADVVTQAGGDLDQIIADLHDGLPAFAVAAAESVPAVPLGQGALPPSPAIEAEMAQMAMHSAAVAAPPVGLPPSVNHALSMSPVRNQGSRGTCVAHAMGAVHEFYRRKSGTPQDYSEQFLYHRTKLIDGAPGACGTWQVKAAQVLNSAGQARESIWAYNPALPCNNNGVEPGTAAADAAAHRLQTIVLNPKDVGAIKAALANGSVVGFSVPCYSSWLNSAVTRNTGRITMRLGGEPVNGGHAMCAIGYQDDANSPGGGFFILRNSWGTGWGAVCPYGAGNGTIPYQYIANDGWEAVTTPKPPSRKVRPWDRWRLPPDWKRQFIRGEDGEGEEGEDIGGRPTIIIDTGGGYDIIIR